MKRSFYFMALIISLVFVWSASSLAADKIGFINMKEVIENSAAGKKAMDDFKKYVDKETAEIKAVEKELKKMKDDLDKQSSIMTQSSQKEKETAYQKKYRDYQLMVNDANEDLRKREQEIAQKLIPGIIKVVQSIAEKEKYTLVIDVASTPPPYYAKENDFSKKVIEEFNKSK